MPNVFDQYTEQPTKGKNVFDVDVPKKASDNVFDQYGGEPTAPEQPLWKAFKKGMTPTGAWESVYRGYTAPLDPLIQRLTGWTREEPRESTLGNISKAIEATLIPETAGGAAEMALFPKAVEGVAKAAVEKFPFLGRNIADWFKPPTFAADELGRVPPEPAPSGAGQTYKAAPEAGAVPPTLKKPNYFDKYDTQVQPFEGEVFEPPRTTPMFSQKLMDGIHEIDALSDKQVMRFVERKHLNILTEEESSQWLKNHPDPRDILYKGLLSTASKDPLKRGETWRSRVEYIANNIRKISATPIKPKATPTDELLEGDVLPPGKAFEPPVVELPSAVPPPGELFTGRETMQTGTRPLIGREATPAEAPLFSKAARETQPEQQSFLAGEGAVSRDLQNDARAALFEYDIYRSEEGGARFFTEAEFGGGYDVEGVKSLAPQWYKDLAGPREQGFKGTKINKAQVEDILKSWAAGKDPKNRAPHVKQLVADAIQGIGKDPLYQNMFEPLPELPPTLPPVHEGEVYGFVHPIQERLPEKLEMPPLPFTGGGEIHGLVKPIQQGLEQPPALAGPFVSPTLRAPDLPKTRMTPNPTDIQGQGLVRLGPETPESLAKVPAKINDPTPLVQGQTPRMAALTRTVAAMRWTREQFPAEWSIWKNMPNSAVISETERIAQNMETGLAKTFSRKWNRPLELRSEDEARTIELHAVAAFETAKRSGLPWPQAWRTMIETMPPDFKAYMLDRADNLLVEQWARTRLKLDPLPEIEGPYLPRVTVQAEESIEYLADHPTGLKADLQTTIQAFQKDREFRTYREGEAHGQQYVPFMKAIYLRDWAGIKLVSTAHYMDALVKKGVLHEDPRTAMTMSPTGKIYPIEGLPGAERYWVPSKDERLFLTQNLTKPNYGIPGIYHLMNRLARNPNLVNPLPHFVKNMGYKYSIAMVKEGGSPHWLVHDAIELEKHPELPMVQRFRDVAPFGKSGQLAEQMLHEKLIPYEENVIKRIAMQAIEFPGKLNKPAAKFIFTKADPWMRYSLWKNYVRQGYSDQAAMNNVWVDLIRYGTRSTVTDFWKAMPGNFFVPWRSGSVFAPGKFLLEGPIKGLSKMPPDWFKGKIGAQEAIEMVKRGRVWDAQRKAWVFSTPIKGALLIGGIDYVREVYYRKTGRHIHLPIDYIEGPLAAVIEQRRPTDIAKVIGTTVVLGPGGRTDYMDTMIKAINGTAEWNDVKKMFWGLSQIFGLGDEVQAGLESGDPKHIRHAIESIMFSAHDALTAEPFRAGKLFPSVLPGMERSEKVREAEEEQADRRERAAEMRERIDEGRREKAAERKRQHVVE